MSLQAVFSSVARALGQLQGASYHPERHYMRGAGPACARKKLSALD
ncbi:MAG: hypothetical protein AAGG56_12530 [Pseudomonadota bacterium]